MLFRFIARIAASPAVIARSAATQQSLPDCRGLGRLLRCGQCNCSAHGPRCARNDKSQLPLRGASARRPVQAARRNNLPGSAKQSGYLLLPVAIAIALIAVLAFLINHESTMEVSQAANEIAAARAGYVAQAGLQHALREHAQQGCGPYTDLTAYPFGGDQYDTMLSHDLGTTTSYSLAVSQDAWIGSFQTSLNHGNDATLHVSQSGGDSETALLRFDLSSLPAGAAILSATAWFYVNTEHPQGALELHRLTADWGESDATWDSMGANLDGAVIASIPPQASAGNWAAINLTGQVQAWVNGEPNFGLAIVAETDGIDAGYSSRESADAAYLEVVVGAPPSSLAKLKSTSKLGGGAAASVKRSVTLRQSPVSYREIRLGPGAGRDVMLDSFYTSRNHGDHSLDLDNLGTLEHTLIQFELGPVPHGARILSASLALYHTVTAGSPTNMGADLFRVKRDWVEGTQSGSGTADGATWNTWDGSSNWTQAGGDFDVQPVTSGPISPAVNDWESWNIGALVQGWVDGSIPNYGLLLKGTGDTEVSFASKEDADPSLRPKLSITYSCACGGICAAPQGSGNILMVVVNPTTLVAEDQQAKDLFESWGYTVDVISESANQATFDAGFAANDVVFISETVNSNTLGAKLGNSPIGVVSQDGDYNPDLGLASGSAHPVGTAINVTDNSHYITQPFAGGALDIYTHAMEQLTSSGSLNADQQQLADIGGTASLVALDKGAAMEGGGSAAGRRVMLPLGTRYRFNWDYLNASGRLLVHRALEWGMSKDKGGKGNVLLVVVNPDSLSAQEAAKKALIEDWDYTVSLIDESDSQASFDAAIAANDVAYIPQEITSSNLGTKLRDAAIGVVNEEGEQVDELGFANDKVFKSRREIDVIDNSHYITQPFATGLLAFALSDQSVHMLAGGIAPGLQTLGASFNTGSLWSPSLATLDPGDELSGGGPAAGRRVQLPWGGGTFDINQLTDDGRSIMQRALEWGANITPPPPSQQLLFVVPSPGSLGPADAAKQALFESWGYTVNQIDDDAPLADFQTAIGANSGAYVSATAVAGSVGSKLFKAPIGVVNANSGLHDDFGFSTVRYISSTNAPLNTVANHYITQPFNGGQVTLYTSDQTSGGPVGTLAADLDQIGSWSSGALGPLGGLVTLDAGAMTSIGENTPGRRAQMPWDSLDVGMLSADGLTILRRSLEWAEGANIDLSPFAHWKLDETTGPTAVDSEGDNDGTWTNGPTPAPGLVDGALDFDGSNDYVDAGTFDVIGAGITMMGWFYADTIGTNDPRIVSKAAGTAVDDAYWQLSTSNSGTERYLRMRIKAGATTSELHDTSTSLEPAQWYFAVATYNAGSGEMKLYLDGSEVASGAHAVGGALDTNPAVPVALGANGTAERFFDGILDDVRIYNRALGADEIADLYAASAPLPPGYYEVYEPWTAATPNTWETFGLAGFGVPANAVVEVAVINEGISAQRWGGVRAVGSTLDRRLELHEAEAGGSDVVTMHVQADASSQIQHYSDNTGQVSFILLGYWVGASYVELFDSFTANDDAVWHDRDLAAIGVGPDQIVEIGLQNSNTGAERLVGLRAVGSSINRRFDLHEAEGGGVDAVSLMVQADASSRVQVYAETVSGISFHVLGYWSTPPGTWTELGGTSARSTPSAAWGVKDVSALAVPPDSITQFVITNDTGNAEKTVGVRAVGSSLDRFANLHEAEAGGSDGVTMHANVDANTEVEWYSESGTSGVFFYPVGAWTLAP